MSKKDWTITIFLVIGVWAIDQVTKEIALQYVRGFNFYGPLGFVLHRNPGAMLGMFSDLPPLLRIVSLSTGGAFLVFTYAAIQFLLPHRTIVLRFGMSILLGGILGNVTDRILDGSVVDFIVLGNPKWTSPAFNMADALQWVGYGMVVFSLIRDGEQIWPTANFRRQIWINPKFQLRFCFVLVAIGVGFSIISGVYSYTFLKITLEKLVIGITPATEAKFLVPFMYTFLVISLFFLVILFLIGRVLSHRMAGPLYAFEKYITDILDGQDRQLKLRAGDEFMHLEALADRLYDRLKSESPNHEKNPEAKQEAPALPPQD